MAVIIVIIPILLMKTLKIKGLTLLTKVTQPVTGHVNQVCLTSTVTHAFSWDPTVLAALEGVSLSLISLSDFFTEKIPGAFYLSVFTFQQSSA